MKPTLADPQTLVICVRIEARGGQVLRFISYPHDLAMSNGNLYRSDLGYEPTAFSVTNGPAPPVLDLSGVFDAFGISRDELISGVWNSAKAYVFATSWANPVEDEEPIGKFVLGKVRIQDERYVVEKMGLIDALNQDEGRTHGPLCPWTLFDETLDGDVLPYHRSRCTGPRSNPDGPLLANYKVTGTVTHVTSNQVWRDENRAEAAGYFNRGSVRWLTGNNAGLRSQEIKAHAADGTITQFLPTYYPVQVGDQYEMIPGCDKRKTGGDCVGKFSNAINFGGFEEVPTSSAYYQRGTGAA